MIFINKSNPIIDGWPLLFPTTFNMGKFTLPDQLEKILGDPKQIWSRDAGTYFCNEAFYRTVSTIRMKKLQTNKRELLPAIFIHVPQFSVFPLDEMVKLLVEVGADIIDTQL